jgi:branched-chain amino acid transport system ATP-binding protein
MRALIGLARVSSGSISYCGDRIEGLPIEERVKLGIATVLEGRGMLPRMTVFENLQMGAFCQPAENLEGDLEKVFATFPILNERLKQLAGTLSGGEQQMLAFGRAMMLRPNLILMDEPSMGLAPVIVEKVFDAIESINKAGTTILLVEQNARMALSVAHRFYVISNGSIVLAGKVIEGELFVNSQDRLVAVSQEELEAAYLEGH